jgi:hypothetical protein
LSCVSIVVGAIIGVGVTEELRRDESAVEVWWYWCGRRTACLRCVSEAGRVATNRLRRVHPV